MKKEDLNLRVVEYDDGYDDVTVHGAVYSQIDLTAMEKAGEKIAAQVLLVKCEKTVFLTVDGTTIQIRGNGEIVVNGVKSLKEAEEILLRLFAAIIRDK